MANPNIHLLVHSHTRQPDTCPVPGRFLFGIKHRPTTRTTFTRRAHNSKKSPEIRVKNESPYALLQHRKDFQFIQDDLFVKYLQDLRSRQDKERKTGAKHHSPSADTRFRGERLKVSHQKTRSDAHSGMIKQSTGVRVEEQVSILLAKISGRSGSAGPATHSTSPAHEGGRRLQRQRHTSSSAEPVRSLSRDISGNSLEEEPQRLQEERLGLSEKIVHSIATLGTVPPTTCDCYLFGHMLGQGAFGKVYRGVHKLTGAKVAIKSIEKTYLKDDRVKRKVLQEVAGMSRIRHKNVVRLFEVFESDRHFHIVMEFCGGGTLLQLVKSRGCLPEPEAKVWFGQLLEAVKACHRCGIVHRDVKLENLFFDSELRTVKLGDFGMSRSVRPGQRVQEQCGTLLYSPPEVLTDREYEPFPVDVWGLGVVLFAMLIGKTPFRAASDQELVKAILKGDLQIPSSITREGSDLLRGMLTVDPGHRFLLEEVERQPWLEQRKECDQFLREAEMGMEQETVLEKMECLGFPAEYVLESVRHREVNHLTATYQLLMMERMSETNRC